MTNALTVYKASAGSGKTFTLAVHYIKLLVLARESGEYAHILGVTFTNKATAEMKDRILSQLYGIAHALPSSEAYLQALREALREEAADVLPDDAIRRRCGEALHQILHDYSRFRIQTIDAFFQTVLRGLAHELGLTANLQVELSDTEVLSKAVDRIVDRLQDEPVVLDWMMSLVRDHIENNQRWDVTRRIKNFGHAIFNEDYLRRGDQLRAVLSDAGFVRSFIQNLRSQEDHALDVVRQLGERLEQTVGNAGLSYADFSNGQRVLSGFVQKLKEGELNDIELSATLLKWADDPMTMVKKADRTRADIVDTADILSDLLSEVNRQLPALQYTVNSARQALAHIKPLFLLDFIDKEVADINAETSRFNLAKTPILLNRMVGESDAPFVFEKVGAMLHHVIIDEFQDTSRLQWENFRVLLLESFSRGGRNLLVGDVKQSIYRWRGGDWRTLGYIDREVQPPPVIKQLDTNFRSMRQVIRFNNDFFDAAARALDQVSVPEEQLLAESDFFATAYGDVRQRCPEARADEGFVRVAVLDAGDYKKREEWEPEILADLVQQVRQLHADGLPYEQMTILVRNNFESAPIIQAFAAEPDLPPIVSDEAFLLEACLPVCLMIEALRLLCDPDNRVSAYYLVSHGVDVAQLAERCETLCLMPLYELLHQLYRDLRLQRFPGQDAYLFGFFDAVSDYKHGESADIPSFLTFWDEKLSRQSIPAGQVNGLRIMTIHKAKGLEFHTVLMPFCTWDFERDRASSLLWCTPAEAPFSDLQLLPITPSSKVTPRSVFAREYAEHHLLSRLDELNTLYVGFTRARSNLYVWAVGADLQRDSRTVGDLVACCMDEVGVGDAGVYTFGRPVVSDRQRPQTEDNRIRLTPAMQPVAMQSAQVAVEFRQSNRSQQFIAGLSEDEPTPDVQARHSYLDMGSLLHRVLQNVRTAGDVGPVLDRFERQGIVTSTDGAVGDGTIRRRDVERWLRQGLQNPLVMSWFGDGWQLFNECSIVSLDTKGQPLVHRPDRVMVSDDRRHVVVVDFKFGQPRPSYEAQVIGYMQLLCQMMPEATVDGYLWFVYSGKVQRVQPNKK